MPTITDATVVAQAYDTSGNGGRKLVRLDNGWLVSVVKTTDYFYFYKTEKGDWSDKTQLCYITHSNIDNSDISIVSVGNTVHALYGWYTSGVFSCSFNATTITNINLYDNRVTVETMAQTALGNVSLAINEAKTELHATWASKNSTYPNSFNIRYAKGTINADGTVTWSAVEQVTLFNSVSYYCTEPAITVVNDKPVILTRLLRNNNCIIVLSKTFSTVDTGIISTSEVGSGWGCKNVYDGAGSYTQSSPTAIFVPQSINGLANGRIECFWSGANSTYVSSTSLYYSYSDDLGVTWSNAVVLVQASSTINVQTPSTTFNKSGNIFVLFHYYNGSVSSVAKLVKSNGTWGSLAVIKSRTDTSGTYPSTLLDSTLSFTEPLFIYKDVSKVGFYGTWTVTTISVTPGDIGQKTDKNNILSYSITTDGEMSTITEKINGTVVNTRNTTSGQAVTLGLTQAQWDAIRFGKYADATGGKNTLTVEMGSEKWTYTFDKQLASDSDIISASKATKDANEVYLPSVKKQMADAINAKGGSVSANADWLTMIDGITGSSNGRRASGTATSSVPTLSFQFAGNTSTITMYYVAVTGLTFLPSVIVISGATNDYVTLYRTNGYYYPKEATVYSPQSLSGSTTIWNIKADISSASVTSNGFTLPVGDSNKIYNWIAFE